MFRRPLLSFAALAVACACLSLSAATGDVRIESGLISGAAADGVRTFKGIPYAAPPVGNLRWKPPQPVSAWSGVKAADAFGPQCPQLPYSTDSPYYAPPRLEGEECLYLNVWTAGTSGDRRPVMVWIHGGALTRGTGATPTYDGTALAKKGVVVVTINYRIGPLGYLSHPGLTAESAHHASGNYGAMDQIAALEWVRRNIAAFGGDNGRVTIFGESAGSTSVNVLTASPLATGLFQRAVGESGARFTRLPTLAEAETLGVAFAKAAGADSIAALRAIPADKLAAAPGFQAQNPVDGWVLPEEVRTIYASKKHGIVPVIVGSNADEMTTLANPATIPKTLEEYRTRVTAQYGDLVKEFDALYPVSGEADVRSAWLGSVRDAGMTLQMRTWARMAAAGGARAYLYWFSHVAPHPDAARLGAYHASEIPYVFANLIRKWNYTDVDRQLANTMSSYWANFAATGDPNGTGLPKWTAYDPDAEPYMDLGDTPQVRNHLQKARLDFLERFQNRPRRSSADQAQTPAPAAHLPRGTATDVTNAEIQAAVQKTAAAPVSDQAIRVVNINGEYNVGIGVVHRAKTAGRNPGGGIEHSQITEVYHVIEGNATLVTGGTIEDPKESAPEGVVVKVLNGPSTGGGVIQGGVSRKVGPGDVVIIPPNTPHWFSEISSDQIVYLVVRVDPHKVLPAGYGAR